MFHYGYLPQRWLLIHSQKACERQTDTFYKKLEKLEVQLEKQKWHLETKEFSCKADAESAFSKFEKGIKFHKLSYQLQQVLKHGKKGRPKKGQQAEVVTYKLKLSKQRDESAIQTALNTKGRFILATNQLDVEQLSDQQLLQEYKAQSQAEAGFRFLKDPWFMVDSVFLKNPFKANVFGTKTFALKRIEALMVIMTLCLMVYNVGQHSLRQQLEENNETLPNQVGKLVKNPTLRWIFRLLQGISVVDIIVDNKIIQQFVSNLNQVKCQIIRYFGPIAMEIYGVT